MLSTSGFWFQTGDAQYFFLGVFLPDGKSHTVHTTWRAMHAAIPSLLEQGFPLACARHTRNDRFFPFHFLDNGHLREIQHNYQLSVNENNAYIAAALTRITMIQTPRLPVQLHLDSGQLVNVLDVWQPPTEQLCVVYPSSHHLSIKLRVFIEWAMGYFV